MKTCQTDENGKPDLDQLDRLKIIGSKIPDDDTLYEHADAIKALGDPTRLKIMYLLKYGELCVCEIITAIEKPQSSVSHHLNILKKAGFLKSRKEGVWVHYSLSNQKTTEILDKLVQNQ